MVVNEPEHEREIGCPKPDCDGEVGWDFTCHTYPTTHARKGADPVVTWMSCLPCDSAIHYQCSRLYDGCDWEYTDGLNPGNPRAVANAKRRPAWLDDFDLEINFGVGPVVRPHPAIRHIEDVWEDDDA